MLRNPIYLNGIMTSKTNYRLRCICFILMLLVALDLTGCCKRKKKDAKKTGKVDIAESIKNIKKKGKKGTSEKTPEFDDVHIDLSGQLPLSEKDAHTSELYEKMNHANKMYKNRNYDGALREVERIQLEINNDPYLEMQTWGLAAMIYDKTGKTSRRKRAYNKLIESAEEVKKDSRYKKAYEDGKICQELIENAKEKGEKQYAAE